MEAYQQRVVDERKELDELSLTLQAAHAKVRERCVLLNKFIAESPVFAAMPEQQRQLLLDQRSCMRSVSGQLSALLYSAEGIERYREILGSRIELF